MQASLDPTKTSVLLLICHIDDKDSFPEQIFKNEYWDKYNFTTQLFKIQRFSDLPFEFWDLIDVANGLLIDDLSTTEEYQKGVYQHGELDSFIKRLIQREEYNGCPIFASIRGFSDKAIILQALVFTWLIRTLRSNGFNFVVNEGDAIVPSREYYREHSPFVAINENDAVVPSGEKPFIRVGNFSFTDGNKEVEDFLYKMKKHHSEFWEPFEVSLKVYGG